MLASPSPFAIRAELEELVLKDLLGPAGGPEEEVDEDRVVERYLVGLLAPRRQLVAPETCDDIAAGGDAGDEDGQADVGALQVGTLFPSSLGMSFCLDGEAANLRVTAGWGRYRRERSRTLTDSKSGNPKLVWKRTPVREVLEPIVLAEGPIEPQTVTEDQPEVTVQGRIDRHGSDWVVSVFLVNGQEEPQRYGKDAAWLFQPELVVESAGGQPVFRRRLERDDTGADSAILAERATMAMLYRHCVEFAVGHGAAVHVEADPADPERAVRVATRAVPFYEVAKQTPPTSEEIPELRDVILDMHELAEMPADQLMENLALLPRAYAAWIRHEREKVRTGGSRLAEHNAAAEEALGRCEQALARIEAGIRLLGENPVAAEAFRFMNHAMALQRVRTLYAREVRRGRDADLEAIDAPKNRTWYPFQLAFILLNLPGVTDLNHPDRSAEMGAIADLLWFPTGGGKTEAYLGLTAYTLAVRRLQGTVEGRPGEPGVAVLMRYTLRLLTLQQFQRAAALMCACETIRREALAAGDDRWGRTPFRLGLWVGRRTTPNTTEQSHEAIQEDHGQFQHHGVVGGSGSPEQLTACPWCGRKIEPGRHIKVDAAAGGRGRTLIYCGDPMGRCPFSERQAPGEGLPTLVVDEEIYRNPPALLIATVDKFAQMPWNGAVQTLFGQVNGYCPRHGFRAPEIEDKDSHPRRGALPRVRSVPHPPLRPPDLIIQDELHLISGPLGSLVGLYETAVDELCSWTVGGRRVRPKVVASTATIRRAPQQVQALFLRQLEVFPPHGTDIRDNFFSRQREPSDEFPGRRYIGICASGKRFPVALIRVYVAFLSAAKFLYDRYGAAVDPWMTLVGYFNSMRELGGTRRLVEDDVGSRLRDMDQRGLAKRRRPLLRELTSRIGATEIPAILDRLEVQFDPVVDEQRVAAKKSGLRSETPDALDVALATNMISVGVDVDRLGLMVVAGQPKTTSEYIQATSRVGRSWPGLVCTVFNWARPRDLSHYERFEHYHATFYQHVEPLSVTPFARRALDRGLSGVLVSLVRLAAERFNENAQAENIDRNHEIVGRAIEALANRAGLVTGETAVEQNVRSLLAARMDRWANQARQPAAGRRLGYQDKRDGVTVGLLRAPGIGGWETFTCLNSLRDVEPEVGLILVDPHGLEDESVPRRGDAAEQSGPEDGV